MPDIKPRLLPCPFCGGEADLRHNRINERWFAECVSGSCMVNPATVFCDTMTEAKTYWNRRKGF